MNVPPVRMLKISLIIIAVFCLFAALIYGIYSFSLFWQTFAAGITISFLLIILVILFLSLIYLAIRNFLLKKEVDNYKNKLNQLKFELERCKSKSNPKNTENDI
jgi:TRAP-type C4-dicarboxylate transport system permease small subunit